MYIYIYVYDNRCKKYIRRVLKTTMLQSNYGNILIAYAVYINISIVKFHKKNTWNSFFLKKTAPDEGTDVGTDPSLESCQRPRNDKMRDFWRNLTKIWRKIRCKVRMENVQKKNRCIKNTSNFRSSKHENMISMISICWFVRFTHFTLEIEVEVQRVVRSLMCLFSIPSFQYKAHRMDGPARLAHLSHLSCNHL